MINELKKAFMHSWTGGASGAPNRYHTPGAFDNFKFADLFDNDRWRREQMVDPYTGGPMFNRGGEPVYTNYYMSRPKKEVTEKLTVGDDGKTTSVVTSKYVDSGEPTVTYDSAWPTRWPGMASYVPPTMRTRYAEEGPGMGSYAPWSDRAGARPPMERGTIPIPSSPQSEITRMPYQISLLGYKNKPVMDLEMKTDLMKELIKYLTSRSD